MQFIIYLRIIKYLMVLSLSVAASNDSYAQKLNIMSMNINSSNIVKQNIEYCYGSGVTKANYVEFVTDGPGIVFNVALINNSTDTLTVLAKKTHSYLRYEFNGKIITMEYGIGIFSEDVIKGEIIHIRPQETLYFQLDFGLLPEYAFSVENYAKNIWQIIPTLQIEMELHRPKGMKITSEPLDWKSITISGE